MRKVKDVINELRDLKECEKIVSKLVNAMEEDNAISKYIRDDLRIDSSDIRKVLSIITLREYDLRNKFEDCEVCMEG